MCSLSPSSLSSIVEDNLAKADCVSASTDEGKHSDWHKAT